MLKTFRVGLFLTPYFNLEARFLKGHALLTLTKSIIEITQQLDGRDSSDRINSYLYSSCLKTSFA
jgi:hypothetical protein